MKWDCADACHHPLAPPPPTFVLSLLSSPSLLPPLFPLSNLPAAAAKSLQPCPTLRDPTDVSPPGSPVPGTLQARILEWLVFGYLLVELVELNYLPHCLMAFWFISSVNYQITFFFYIQTEIVCIVCICLFFHLYLSIFSFWCSYVFLIKAKKNFIFIFLTPFFNEDFYSIILIVIINKPEFISAILLHAFLFFF